MVIRRVIDCVGERVTAGKGYEATLLIPCKVISVICVPVVVWLILALPFYLIFFFPLSDLLSKVTGKKDDWLKLYSYLILYIKKKTWETFKEMPFPSPVVKSFTQDTNISMCKLNQKNLGTFSMQLRNCIKIFRYNKRKLYLLFL